MKQACIVLTDDFFHSTLLQHPEQLHYVLPPSYSIIIQIDRQEIT